MATLVIRNIVVKGKMPSSDSASRSKTGRESIIWWVSAISAPGRTSSRATVRWSPRSCRNTRPAVAATI
jgi:hypothetical protein